MNTWQIIAYYKNLLIREYNGLPKASKTVGVFVASALIPQGHNVITDNEGNPIFDNEGQPIYDGDYIEPIIPLAIAQAFNIATAVGAQLVILGKYVGVSNQGYDFSGPITLTDTQFRELIQIAAIRNSLTGTLAAIDAFIFKYFGSVLQVFDDLKMHMTYYYSQPIGSNVVAEFFIEAGLLPKPLGVGMDVVFFGYDYWGFYEDPNADTFSDVNNPTVGGYMPELIYP